MSDQKTQAANVVAAVPISKDAIQLLLDAGKSLGAPQKLEDRRPFMLVPDGYRIELAPPIVTEEKPLPTFIQQSVELHDCASFCAYVKLFETPTTRIFATPLNLAAIRDGGTSAAVVTAFLDYHESGAERTPGRNEHVARYPLPLSIEFRIWLSKDGKPQSQADFIQWIEANGVDIKIPDSAKLMEMVMNFESKSTVQFQSSVNRVMGGRQLVFKEDIEQTSGAGIEKKVTVPEYLTLRMPVFECGAAFEFRARMEYRPTNGKLNVTYFLERPHIVLRDAFLSIRADIESEQGIGIPILTGAAL